MLLTDFHSIVKLAKGHTRARDRARHHEAGWPRPSTPVKEGSCHAPLFSGTLDLGLGVQDLKKGGVWREPAG